MFSYLKGELVEVLEESIVLEVNGIGYGIQMPGRMLSKLPPIGAALKVYTYLYVREDALSLYGFLTKDALDLFQMLIAVSGIGPKGGLAILSVLSPDELRFAVLGEDEKAISKAPGVGLKTAKRLIIELKDKFSLEETFEHSLSDQADHEDGTNQIKNDAVAALTALGYSSTEALQVLQKVDVWQYGDVESVLKEALKKMSFL